MIGFPPGARGNDKAMGLFRCTDQRSKIKNPISKINMDSRQEHAGMTKRWDYYDVSDQRSKIKDQKSKI